MPLPNKKLVGVLILALAGRAQAQRLPSSVGAQEINLYARLLAMTDTRQLDMPLVERALSNQGQPLRAAATISIGQVGHDAGKPGLTRLRSLLKDPDLTVGADAAYAPG